MQPDAVAAFIKAFTRAANDEAGSQEAARTRLEAERAAAGRKLDGLYDAIAEGLRTPGLQAKLEARIADLGTRLAAPAPAPARLNPNLSELYRRKVARLAATLADPSIRTGALETVLGLIERVVVSHEGGRAIVALEGALAALIGLAQNAKSPSEEGLDGNTLACSAKVVAGAGFEPATFRL